MTEQFTDETRVMCELLRREEFRAILSRRTGPFQRKRICDGSSTIPRSRFGGAKTSQGWSRKRK